MLDSERSIRAFQGKQRHLRSSAIIVIPLLAVAVRMFHMRTVGLPVPGTASQPTCFLACSITPSDPGQLSTPVHFGRASLKPIHGSSLAYGLLPPYRSHC